MLLVTYHIQYPQIPIWINNGIGRRGYRKHECKRTAHCTGDNEHQWINWHHVCLYICKEGVHDHYKLDLNFACPGVTASFALSQNNFQHVTNFLLRNLYDYIYKIKCKLFSWHVLVEFCNQNLQFKILLNHVEIRFNTIKMNIKFQNHSLGLYS